MSSDTHRAVVERMPSRVRLVLTGLLRGLSEKLIARELAMSRHTVHAHVKDIYRRLDVHTRAELLVALLAPPHAQPPFEAHDVDAVDGASSSGDSEERSDDGQANATTARPHAR